MMEGSSPPRGHPPGHDQWSQESDGLPRIPPQPESKHSTVTEVFGSDDELLILSSLCSTSFKDEGNATQVSECT